MRGSDLDATWTWLQECEPDECFYFTPLDYSPLSWIPMLPGSIEFPIGPRLLGAFLLLCATVFLTGLSFRLGSDTAKQLLDSDRFNAVRESLAPASVYEASSTFGRALMSRVPLVGSLLKTDAKAQPK